MSLTQCQTGRRHFCVYMEFLLLSTPCTVINFYSEYYINTTRRAYHAKNKISRIYFHSHHIRLYDLHYGCLQRCHPYRRTSGSYIRTRTTFLSTGMAHRIPLRILHRQQNLKILRIPRSQTRRPPNLHHPLHPDLHRLHNGTTHEPARNHRILRLHLKSDLDMD